jgi:hypothetical protein
MIYLERERQRLIAVRDAMFRDPGQGWFAGRPRDFVLSEPAQNLWAGVREDALDYFARHRISWWGGKENDPTGHLLSSQIACVNHLYPLRQRLDLATALLTGIDPDIVAAEPLDEGFVEFEFVGTKQHLKERGFSRGSHCTSVDAAMVGRTTYGELRLFLIEWKYTESYGKEDKYIPARAAVYDHHITAENSPFCRVDPKALYFEPFYQLMRQTLLGWLLVMNAEHGCTSYRHVHVAPAGNRDFLEGVTSPGLEGNTVYEAWRSVLKQPELFVPTSPEVLMTPLAALADTRSHLDYLAARYWAGA